MSKSGSSVSFGMGVLFGVLAGVAAGILFSPKSGEEVRQEIKNKTKNMGSDIDTVKNTSSDLVNKLMYTFENQYKRINDAIKAGKMASAKKREELESGYNF